MGNVLVTGGMGFVGSALCRQLCALGMDVSILDNESKGQRKNIDGLPVAVHSADIRDRDQLGAILRATRPSLVIHLAAIHFLPECDGNPARCLEVNVVGTEHVLSACREVSPERVIVTSSMAVYPIKDTASVETDQPGPYDVYGESKLSNELQAGRFQRETGIDTIAVRLSNCYGPRETNPHVVPEIMEQIKSGAEEIRLGNIDARRDFIHVDDAAKGFAALALHTLPSGYHVVNLTSGKEYSVRQILSELSEILAREIRPVRDETRYRRVERMHLLGDVSRIKHLTEWQPCMSLREGLTDLCKWYGVT